MYLVFCTGERQDCTRSNYDGCAWDTIHPVDPSDLKIGFGIGKIGTKFLTGKTLAKHRPDFALLKLGFKLILKQRIQTKDPLTRRFRPCIAHRLRRKPMS